MATQDASALIFGAPVLLFSVWLYRYTRSVRRQRDAAVQRGGSGRDFRGKLLLLDLNWTTGIALGLALSAAGGLGLYREQQEARRAERLRKLVATCTESSLTIENQNDEALTLTISDVRAGTPSPFQDRPMTPLGVSPVTATLARGARRELSWSAGVPKIRLSLIDARLPVVRAYISARTADGEEVVASYVYCAPH